MDEARLRIRSGTGDSQDVTQQKAADSGVAPAARARRTGAAAGKVGRSYDVAAWERQLDAVFAQPRKRVMWLDGVPYFEEHPLFVALVEGRQ